MGWSAAGWVVVDKTAHELREVVSDTLAEIGPMSGYGPQFADSSFALGQTQRGAALWDPIGKLAFGPRGEDLRRAASKGTRLVAFRVSSAQGKLGVAVYEDGAPVRTIEVEAGKPVRQVGPALEAEREVAAPATGLDEDWMFALIERVTGVGFEALGDARYELLELS